MKCLEGDLPLILDQSSHKAMEIAAAKSMIWKVTMKQEDNGLEWRFEALKDVFKVKHRQ